MPPTALIESIQTVRRRACRLSVAYGVGIVIASALGLLVGLVGLDYLLNLPAGPRVIGMLVSIGALGYLGYRFIFRPAARAPSLSDVAGRLDKAFPQFEDRLRTTVNFIEGRNPGSAVLQQRVIDQTAQIISNVDLNRALIAKPALLSVGGAIASLALLLAITLGAMDRNILSIIASRLFSPFDAQSWPKRVQINLTSQVPTHVPVGQKIELAMKLDRGDKASLKPIVHYQVDNGPLQQMFMTRGEDGQFRVSLDARLEQAAVTGKLGAWIEAGDDSRRIGPITIVQRLSIKSIVANVTPPLYVSKRSASTQDLSAAPVVTAEGSQIAIAVRFNKQLSMTDPVLEPIAQDAKAPEIKWSRDGAQNAVAAFVATAPLRFRVRATDVDGFANTALEEYELIVRPDANLTIQIENPRRSEERTAQAFVPLQAVAEDDCGIEWVKLVVQRLQPSPQQWEIPLVTGAAPEKEVAWTPVESSPDRARNRLNYKWELSPLKLSVGDVIEYHVLARDNFDLAGRRHEPVASSKLRITIISQEDLAARVTNELRAVKTQTAGIRRTQQQTKLETQTLSGDTKDKAGLDPGDKTVLDRLSQQQSGVASATKQLAARVQTALDRLEENRSESGDLKDISNNVKTTLDRASENPMKDAAQNLSDSAQPRADKPQRNDALAKAQDNQQKALEELDRVMAGLENIGSLQSTIAEIAAILKDQKQSRKDNEEIAKTSLGKKPEEMSDQDRDRLKANADKQEELTDRTEKAIANMGKQSKQMEKSDPSASEAMKSAAQKAQDSKVTPNQRRAAQQTRQNQQAGAQQAQQLVELGLEQVLAELKEAERRELARLREQLAQLQEQIATLIRRQSGHNLDNVLIQGPEKLKALDPKLVVELTALAQRKPDQFKAPEARQLTSGQELTERNTRDIARTADASPQTAQIAASLTKAAGKMERAIVSLRADKLPDAYDPSQIEALAALREAKKQIDDQKKEADDKVQQQQKDAIRARYEKIKAEQEKLNADTARVEKSRDAKGAIPRNEWPTIARLPKDEQGLSERTAGIEEDLQSLGSIVYIWANKDIKNSMDQVKDDLLASRTAPATQSEQMRIVEQLDAMIKNLSEKPSESKFESNSGGGNGGQGQKKPKMPTEAELKMLKSLQQAVNKSTARIDAEPNKDQQKLLSLGNRQGELRNLLDNLLKTATQGQLELGAEPDNKDQLPEEAEVEDIDRKELEDMLAGDGAAEKKIEQDFKLVGTRMARSRQRLALNNDPGKITQEIQNRILKDMDSLIEMAQKNQQQQSSSSSAQQPNPGQKPQPNRQQANTQGQNKPGAGAQPNKSQEGAVNQNTAGAGSKPRDLKDIRETASEWGNITPRVRDAVIESKGETVVEQYRKLIEDYYEALSIKGTRREP